MTDLDTLTSLRERVIAAEGNDPALNADLYAMHRAEEKRTRILQPGEGWLTADLEYTPLYTASIDAALGLVERMLPGWQWMVRGRSAKVWSPAELRYSPNDWWADGATPPLAILAALLSALIANAKGET